MPTQKEVIFIIMNKLIEKVFENRGYDKDFIRSINNPEHDDLKDVGELARRLKLIYDSGDKIVILPDFDMDGIMSGTLGFAGLAELGFNVSLFIPNPADGYEFTSKTIDRLISEYPDVKVILTCDTGISCYDGVKYAKDMGLDVIITDHHKQNDKKLSDMKADCIVNPMRVDETYAHPEICGAYVLYQCVQYYAECFADSQTVEQIKRLRVFAGMGTISDSMPLRYENRRLVKDCISICRLIWSKGNEWFVTALQGTTAYKSAFVGLFEVLDRFASEGKIKSSSDINESFVGYYLAPMFNSVKRMEGDMSRAFGVFFRDNRKDDIDYLFSLNNRRKVLVEDYYERLISNEGDQPFAPYVYISEAASGILGLLATKILNETGTPVIVVRKCDDGMYRGSGRSPVWYHMISRCSEAGFYVSGHEVAFGIGITDKRELKSLVAFLKKDVSDVKASLDADEFDFKPDFVIATDGTGDTAIDIPLFAEYLNEIDSYRPFGSAFPEPVSVLRFRPEECEWTVIGSTKQHLKLRFGRGFSVLCWNQANLMDKAKKWSEVCVVGHLAINEFNNVFTINFMGDISED